MLFDLSSPRRKTAVRIVFGFLAVIFAVGFVGFGIGGELGGGGIIDSLTGGGGSTDDAFEQPIEDAEKALETDPEDPNALADLVLLRYQSGEAQLDLNEETGVPSLTEDARNEFEEAVLIWQRYLDADPKKVDPAATSVIVQAYIFLEDIEGVISAQKALAESDPTGPNLAALANFLYRDLQIEAADKARDQALDESDADTRKQLTQEFASIRGQALKAEKAEKKQPESATGESSELSDPFGGLGGSDPGGTIDPGTLPAP